MNFDGTALPFISLPIFTYAMGLLYISLISLKLTSHFHIYIFSFLVQLVAELLRAKKAWRNIASSVTVEQRFINVKTSPQKRLILLKQLKPVQAHQLDLLLKTPTSPFQIRIQTLYLL
jgi:hypothetical protein